MFHMKHRKNGPLGGVWRGSKGGLTRTKAARGGILPARAGVLAIMAIGLLLANPLLPEASARAAAPPATPKPPARAPEKVAFTDNAKQGAGEDGATREFAYTWPAQVSAVPQLSARFTAERTQLLTKQKADWAEALREFAADDCGGCVNRGFAKTWEVVADLPRFLSLSSDSYEYSGGAHGYYWMGALVWDRQTRRAFDPKAMFRSRKALQAALGEAWCKALKAERTKRLGADYSDDGIFTCPPISDLAVLVGSSDKKSFNRIGLVAAPYVAGSYAEGEYELTFPVTPKVLAAVKPEFKAAFALGK